MLSDYTGAAYTYEKLAVAASVVPLTAAKYAPFNESKARAAVITVETNTIKFTTDGTDPVAGAGGNGHNVVANTTFEVIGYQNVAKLKMIQLTAAATVHITYLR